MRSTAITVVSSATYCAVLNKKGANGLLWYFMVCTFVLHREMKTLVERHKLDRRRLEAAHFQFAVLQVAMWYPEHITISEIPLHAALQETLPKIVAVYQGAFMEKYASKLATCSAKESILYTYTVE